MDTDEVSLYTLNTPVYYSKGAEKIRPKSDSLCFMPGKKVINLMIKISTFN